MKPVDQWTPEDHKAALEWVNSLVTPDGETEAPEELADLAAAIMAYEQLHFPSPKRTLWWWFLDMLDAATRWSRGR